MTNHRCPYIENNCIMAKLSETCYRKTHYECGIYLRKEESTRLHLERLEEQLKEKQGYLREIRRNFANPHYTE
jgi:hypothetical protein